MNEEKRQWNPRCNIKIHNDVVIITDMNTGEWTFIKKNVFNNICYYLRKGEEMYGKLREIEKMLISKKILIDASFGMDSESVELVTIMLTNQCNLSCKHCCVGDIEWKEENNLQYVIEEVVKINPKEIILTGGEPMMLTDFMDMVRYIRSIYKGKLRLSTNGTLINKTNVQELSQLIDKFDLSLDGVISSDTCNIRGKGVWEKVICSLELLKLYGVQQISTSMVLTDFNRENVGMFYEMNKRFGTYPIVRNMTLNDRVLKNIYELYDGGLEKYKEDEIKRIKNLKNNNSYMCKRTCGMIRYQLFITANGDMYPCGGLATQQFYLGNLVEIGGIDLFYKHEKQYMDMITNRLLKNKSLSKCIRCGLRDLCWKCVAIVNNYTIVPECFEEYCNANKENIEKAIQKEKEEKRWK